MRAELKPSILGQWLCAGDLGLGRGRGRLESWMPASKKQRGGSTTAALPAPVGERLPAPAPCHPDVVRAR